MLLFAISAHSFNGLRSKALLSRQRSRWTRPLATSSCSSLLDASYWVLGNPAPEKFIFSAAESLLLDSQVRSSPQLSAGSFFLMLNGCLDRIRVGP